MTDQLFDPGEPRPIPAPLSADQKRTIRNRELIARGVHPVSGRGLIAGHTCGECAHHCEHRMGKTYHKCDLHFTGCASTDIRVSWPACDRFEPGNDE